MAGPLKGLRVIDMTRVIAGPTAGQTLADLGAEVVKVERLGDGDDVRTLGPPWLPDERGEPTGESTYFQAVNRGKLSLQLDFAQPDGAAIIRRMAAKADVLLENFRPGTLAKYGLGYADLAAINQGIVVASITGFGHTGPYAERSGYDLLVQAMAGLMQATGLPDGEPGGGPMRVGIPLADMMAGQNVVIGVLAALRHRDATGIGQHVDIALFDSQLAMMLQHSTAWLNTRTKIPRSGNQHLSSIPYGVFQASDGPVLIVTSTDREWVRLSRALGHPEWAEDPRFVRSRDRAANREEVTRLVSAALSGMKRQAAIEAMLAEKIPAGPINDMEDVESDPQVAARGMIISLPRADGRRVRVIGSPLKLSATPVEYGQAAPMAGEHTDHVLADWAGMSAEEIAEAHRKSLV